MAITDKEQGVWDVDQVYNKINQGGIWSYDGTGALYTWGDGAVGGLGLNNKTDLSSPTQVPGTTWSTVVTGAYVVSALKTDGTLWMWGQSGSGSLGDNSRTSRSSPIQIPGTNWGSYMEVTKGSSFAIKTDGTLWAWGHNESGYGRLGLNNKTSYSSPAQIPGTTWDKISTHGYTTMATKTNGTLWTWGAANVGQLGLNGPVNTNYSSPKQVPGTTWRYAWNAFAASFVLKDAE